MIVLVWKKGGGEDGVLSVHVFIGESLEHKGVEVQMFSHSVYSFALLNGSGRWKRKDFKGDRYLPTCIFCYAVVAISIQPLSLTLYTEAQTPSSPSQKKGVYSPSEVTVH